MARQGGLKEERPLREMGSCWWGTWELLLSPRAPLHLRGTWGEGVGLYKSRVLN